MDEIRLVRIWRDVLLFAQLDWSFLEQGIWIRYIPRNMTLLSRGTCILPLSRYDLRKYVCFD